MCMLDKRLQVLVDHERYERLAKRAKERGTSIGMLVREAIDSCYPDVEPRRKLAAKRILAAEPMPLPDIKEFKRELDAIRGNRH
ncbi:MAG: antitoxin [Acidobacteria bacterium]|nr:MAG: antitoxin [Acidobacteriota bacterium]